MACILWLYMCVCCKYANFVEIATCVRAQRCEKRSLPITAIHFAYTPWHVRIRRVNGNIRSYVVAIMFALRVALGGSHTCHNPMNTLWRTMRYSSHQRTVSVAYHSVPTPTTSWLPPAIGCWEVQDRREHYCSTGKTATIWTCTGLLLGGCEYWGRGERGRERVVLMTIRHVCGRVHVPAMNIHVFYIQ